MPPNRTELERLFAAGRALREANDAAVEAYRNGRDTDRARLVTGEHALASVARALSRGPLLVRLTPDERRVVNRAIRYRTLVERRDSADGSRITYEGRLTLAHRCNAALDALGRAAHWLAGAASAGG